MLVDMGFSTSQARKALRETVRGCGSSPKNRFLLSFTRRFRGPVRAEIRSAPSNGSSHIQTIWVKNKKAQLKLKTITVTIRLVRHILAPPLCQRGIACARSSRTRVPRSILAITSRTFVRRGTVMTMIAGYSSMTKKSSGRTRRAFSRSNL